MTRADQVEMCLRRADDLERLAGDAASSPPEKENARRALERTYAHLGRLVREDRSRLVTGPKEERIVGLEEQTRQLTRLVDLYADEKAHIACDLLFERKARRAFLGLFLLHLVAAIFLAVRADGLQHERDAWRLVAEAASAAHDRCETGHGTPPEAR